MAVQTDTIDNYFKKKYEGEIEKIYQTLNSKLLSYKFPSEICLSSSYQDTSTLLGTLTFEELDINDYPTYTGDVIKSEGFEISLTYSTILIFGERSWQFTLTDKKSGETIIIRSERTTSLDPTKVNYSGISTPTAGACRT